MDALNDAGLNAGTGQASCLLLNADGDLAMAGGSMVLARGTVGLGQRLRMAVRLWFGEWFLDVTQGLRWKDVLGAKPADVVAVASMVRARLAAEAGVARVERTEAALDSRSRRASLTYVVVAEDGTTLTDTVEV